MYVDACINDGLLTRLLAQAPTDLAMTALPLQAVGKSNRTSGVSRNALLMLDLRPDLGRMDRAANFVGLMHTMAEEYRWPAPEGRIAIGCNRKTCIHRVRAGF